MQWINFCFSWKSRLFKKVHAGRRSFDIRFSSYQNFKFLHALDKPNTHLWILNAKGFHSTTQKLVKYIFRSARAILFSSSSTHLHFLHHTHKQKYSCACVHLATSQKNQIKKSYEENMKRSTRLQHFHFRDILFHSELARSLLDVNLNVTKNTNRNDSF